jgi:hypothetical protein
MRQRWMDEARTEGTGHGSGGSEQAVVDGETPAASEDVLLNQLASAILGPEAAAGIDGASPGEVSTESESGGAAPDSSGSAKDSTSSAGSTDSGRGTEDDAYLDRARSVASRRGRPDSEETETRTAAAASAASAAPAAPAGPAPLREEGGYQVPSPFLRAALARLAAAPAE